MSIIKQAADAVYSYRFLRLLTTPWEKTDAYKEGVIDKNGKLLLRGRERNTTAKQSSYTIFHRLVFNLKRILEKLPLGRTRLASYAAALFLIKENTGMDDAAIKKVLNHIFDDIESALDLQECHKWFINENKLIPGVYTLNKNINSIETGEPLALKGSKIKVDDLLESYGNILGLPVYKVQHILTSKEIFITNQDIER